MDITIKKYADAGDKTNLKYIFAGAFDADPTFEKYEEEFQYCKTKGVFDTHAELTPFIEDRSKWDENYWYNLQSDLKKNFSSERLAHMKDVAQVVFAQKAARLREERKARADIGTSSVQMGVPSSHSTHQSSPQVSAGQSKLKEQQEQELEAARREIEAHNQAVAAEQKQEQERLERIRMAAKESEATPPKKALGRVAAVILILIAGLALVIIFSQRAHASDSPLKIVTKEALNLL